MKKFLVCITCALGCWSYIVPVQARFFPPQVQETCQPARKTKRVDDLTKCITAQLEVADDYLKAAYGFALEKTEDKQALETSQKHWNESKVIFCPSGEKPNALEAYRHLQCLYDLTVTRAFEVAATVLPHPSYPRKVEAKCEKPTVPYDYIACAKEKLALDKEFLAKSYAEALEKAESKEVLEKSQKIWDEERNEVCPYDSINEQLGTAAYLECLRNRILVRSAKLAGLIAIE